MKTFSSWLAMAFGIMLRKMKWQPECIHHLKRITVSLFFLLYLLLLHFIHFVTNLGTMRSIKSNALKWVNPITIAISTLAFSSSYDMSKYTWGQSQPWPKMFPKAKFLCNYFNRMAKPNFGVTTIEVSRNHGAPLCEFLSEIHKITK